MSFVESDVVGDRRVSTVLAACDIRSDVVVDRRVEKVLAACDNRSELERMALIFEKRWGVRGAQGGRRIHLISIKVKGKGKFVVL